MIKELIYKWFHIEEPICRTCEVLQRELETIRRERDTLLNKILNPPVPELPKMEETETKPVPLGRRHIPYQIRQQLMQKNDEHSLKLMQDHKKKVAELEKEVIGDGDNAGKDSEAV